MIKANNKLQKKQPIQNAGIRLARRVWDYREMYLLLLPAFALVFIFNYIPMYGIIMAFQDVGFGDKFGQSDWVGLYHIKRFLNGILIDRLLRNTVLTAIVGMMCRWPIGLLLAFLLHNSTNRYIKKATQSLTYIPHLFSAVVIINVFRILLGYDNGLINQLIEGLGFDRIHFLTEGVWIIPIYVLSDIWAHTGADAVVYIGALSGVDEQMMEAARIDGASKWRIIWNIQLPSIMPTVITMLILSMGNLFNVGAEKMLLLQNDLNLENSEIISTYVYKHGVKGALYGYSAAIGLFQNVVNLAMMLIVNWLGDKFAGMSVI